MIEQWETLSQELAIEHPFLRVTMDTVRLPDGQVIADWPTVHAGDYVNVLVVNSDGEGLVLEGYKHGIKRQTWQTVGGLIDEGEDPYSAVQRELLEETGLECRQWRHLSSFVVDANRHVGTGHFFLGYGPNKVQEAKSGDLEAYEMRWISAKELKHGLWDGRFGGMSYGINVALALIALNDL